jgi:hypothetical protein
VIERKHEGPRSGTGARFADTVAIDFCDGERDLYGIAWITRLPNAGRVQASAVVFAGGELAEMTEHEDDGAVDDWGAAQAGGVRMTTAVPLERWSLAVTGSSVSLELDAYALLPPLQLEHPELSHMTGIEQYEHVCRVDGTLGIAGSSSPLRGTGRRVHCWGEFGWDRVDRWRTLYAASDGGRAISVAAARPAGSDGHDSELRWARLFGTDTGEPAFDQVRLSTVFDAGGLPAKAGLELLNEGDEFPLRLGGEAVCGARSERDGHEIAISFFRWSLEGEPAYGCYEMIVRK